MRRWSYHWDLQSPSRIFHRRELSIQALHVCSPVSGRECKHSDSLTQQLFRITHNFHEHFTNVPHSSTTKLQLTTPTTANNSISPLPTQSPQPQHPSITTSSPQTNGPHQPIFPPSAPYTKTTCTACPTYPHSLPH